MPQHTCATPREKFRPAPIAPFAQPIRGYNALTAGKGLSQQLCLNLVTGHPHSRFAATTALTWEKAILSCFVSVSSHQEGRARRYSSVHHCEASESSSETRRKPVFRRRSGFAVLPGVWSEEFRRRGAGAT